MSNPAYLKTMPDESFVLMFRHAYAAANNADAAFNAALADAKQNRWETPHTKWGAKVILAYSRKLERDLDMNVYWQESRRRNALTRESSAA